MLVESGAGPRMPINLPGSDQLRQLIAEMAAQLSGGSIDHYLSLIGRVEPLLTVAGDDGAPWRLSAFFGSYSDVEMIDQAAQAIQRTHPRMEA